MDGRTDENWTLSAWRVDANRVHVQGALGGDDRIYDVCSDIGPDHRWFEAASKALRVAEQRGERTASFEVSPVRQRPAST